MISFVELNGKQISGVVDQQGIQILAGSQPEKMN